MKSGTLYVIQEKFTPEFKKIGVTKNRAEQRMKQLQTGNPRDLEVQHEFKALDRYASEKHLHDALDAHFVDAGGDEWYYLKTDDNLNRVINQMIERREITPITSYTGDVDYLNIIMQSIGIGALVVGGIILAASAILFLIWSGAFL